MRMRRMRMIGSCSGLIFFIWPLWGEGRYWEWMTLLAISNLVYHIINHDYFMLLVGFVGKMFDALVVNCNSEVRSIFYPIIDHYIC